MRTRYETGHGGSLPRVEIELDLREAHSLGTALLSHAGLGREGEDVEPAERRLRHVAERLLRVRLTLSTLDIREIVTALDERRTGAPQARSELIAAAVLARLGEALEVAHEHRGNIQNLPRGFRETPTEPKRTETQGETNNG